MTCRRLWASLLLSVVCLGLLLPAPSANAAIPPIVSPVPLTSGSISTPGWYTLDGVTNATVTIATQGVALTGTGNAAITLQDGSTLLLWDAALTGIANSPGIAVADNAAATLYLRGDNTVKGGIINADNVGPAAIQVPASATLTILGPGALTAEASELDADANWRLRAGGAGIGGSQGQNSGRLFFDSASVTSTGREGGAGIGGGRGTAPAPGPAHGDANDIQIRNSLINAASLKSAGGHGGGAGIGGGGVSASNPSTTWNGGNAKGVLMERSVVVARSESSTVNSATAGGAGIGGGGAGVGNGGGGHLTGEVLISEGSWVDAHGGDGVAYSGGAGIGGGAGNNTSTSTTGVSVYVDGGHITSTGAVRVLDSSRLRVQGGNGVPPPNYGTGASAGGAGIGGGGGGTISWDGGYGGSVNGTLDIPLTALMQGSRGGAGGPPGDAGNPGGGGGGSGALLGGGGASGGTSSASSVSIRWKGGTGGGIGGVFGGAGGSFGVPDADGETPAAPGSGKGGSVGLVAYGGGGGGGLGNGIAEADLITPFTPPTMTAPDPLHYHPLILQITNQPAPAAAVIGGSASFTASVLNQGGVATGTGVKAFQWQASTDGGTNWLDVQNGAGVTGASSQTLTLTGLTLADSGTQYRCYVRDAALQYVPSNPAALTVTARPAPQPLPKTGDFFPMELLLGAMAVMLALVGFLFLKNKRRSA